MSGSFSKLFFYVAIPILLFIWVSQYHPLYGLAVVVLYFLFSLYSNRASLFTWLGSVSYYRGNTEKALQFFKKAYKTGKCKPRDITTYAFILLRSGHLDEAERVLSALLYKRIPEDDRLYAKSIQGLVIWKKGQLDEAVALLEEVIERYKTTSIYGSLGYLLILKGDLDKALQFNLEAYDYNNSDAIIVDNLGQTYYLMGDYEKAEKYYEELEKLNPQFPAGWYNYALLLMKKGNDEKALECLKKAQSFKLSFLSTVTAEEIQSAIDEVEQKLGKKAPQTKEMN